MLANIWKERIIRYFCIHTWRFWEMLGIHVIPNHFYWPVQDSRLLQNYNFDTVFPTDGVRLDMNKMLALLASIEKYSNEYASIHTESGYSSNGDGAILYGMIRRFHPQRVIEVGSGYSTRIIHRALERNRDDGYKMGGITSIEPYPKQVLRELVEQSDNITLIEQKVENVNESVFQKLTAGDVLFIDTSHVVDIANDVHYLYLRILPRIPAGVIVHIHDIRYPYEYPREWVLNGKKHWAEQYLLHMFLCFNESYEVLFASNYVYQNNRWLMSKSLVGLQESGGGWPGSFWIRRIK